LPDDPLFARRAPLEAKATFAPPISIAYSEPAIPLDPNIPGISPAYANHRPLNPSPAPSGRQVLGILTNRSTPPERDIEPEDE
jgi:hypothetical protein